MCCGWSRHFAGSAPERLTIVPAFATRQVARPGPASYWEPEGGGVRPLIVTWSASVFPWLFGPSRNLTCPVAFDAGTLPPLKRDTPRVAPATSSKIRAMIKAMRPTLLRGEREGDSNVTLSEPRLGSVSGVVDTGPCAP